MLDTSGVKALLDKWLTQDGLELHWRKIRIEIMVRRALMDAGLLPDPLQHIIDRIAQSRPPQSA